MGMKSSGPARAMRPIVGAHFFTSLRRRITVTRGGGLGGAGIAVLRTRDPLLVNSRREKQCGQMPRTHQRPASPTDHPLSKSSSSSVASDRPHSGAGHAHCFARPRFFAGAGCRDGTTKRIVWMREPSSGIMDPCPP